METKHTKGEWILNIDRCEIVSENDCTKNGCIDLIAQCYTGFNKTINEARANAKLIAAAPELLDALVGLINSINPEDACRGKYKDFQPENPEIAKKAYVGAKSTPADEQILKALEAIEKATK